MQGKHSQALGFRIIFSFAAVVLVGYIIYRNVEPFGITLHYSSANAASNAVSPLGPANRIEKVNESVREITKQINDLIYFSTKHDYRLETANVRITYKNPNPNQELFVGFQDSTEWHYQRKLLDAPILNALGWSTVGNDPVLFQRTQVYKTAEDFFANPPADAFIGIYKYDKDFLLKNTKLPGYTPSDKETVIPIPIRGRFTMYVYVENEPLRMTVSKQDLNWYDDPDVTTVRIYKEKDLVYSQTLDDDGITDASRAVMPVQVATIENPGPGFPEPGVYKIVVDAPGDTIVKEIRTNLHKIVFEGPLFLAGNSGVYPKIIDETSPVSLYTDSLILTASTYHAAGVQAIRVGSETMHVRSVKSETRFSPKARYNVIVVPKNDIILNGLVGYFALTEDAFFRPSSYNIVLIQDSSDTELVDYILADYHPPKQNGDWNVSDVPFDLTNARPKNGRLSWVLLAPNLAENKRSIAIDSIDMDLYKKPLVF